MKTDEDVDGADEFALNTELERAQQAVRQLVAHMVRMGANAISIPAKCGGETYLVTVTKIPR